MLPSGSHLHSQPPQAPFLPSYLPQIFPVTVWPQIHPQSSSTRPAPHPRHLASGTQCIYPLLAWGALSGSHYLRCLGLATVMQGPPVWGSAYLFSETQNITGYWIFFFEFGLFWHQTHLPKVVRGDPQGSEGNLK